MKLKLPFTALLLSACAAMNAGRDPQPVLIKYVGLDNIRMCEDNMNLHCEIDRKTRLHGFLGHLGVSEYPEAQSHQELRAITLFINGHRAVVTTMSDTRVTIDEKDHEYSNGFVKLSELPNAMGGVLIHTNDDGILENRFISNISENIIQQSVYTNKTISKVECIYMEPRVTVNIEHNGSLRPISTQEENFRIDFEGAALKDLTRNSPFTCPGQEEASKMLD